MRAQIDGPATGTRPLRPGPRGGLPQGLYQNRPFSQGTSPSQVAHRMNARFQGSTTPRASSRGRAQSALPWALVVGLLLLCAPFGASLSAGAHMLASPDAAPALFTNARTAGPSEAAVSTSPSGGWQSFDSGNVTLLFETQAPEITLFQDANPSIRATLAFEHILEVTSVSRGSGGSHGPMGLMGRAFAFPSGSTPWNSSIHGSLSNAAGVWVNLSANLTVRALAEGTLQGDPVWQGPNGDLPTNTWGATLGTTALQVTFHLSGVGTPAEQGLAKVGISINGWPWVNPADSLALEWQFFAPGNGTEDIGCSSTAPPTNGTAGASPCAQQTGLGVGAPIWANGTTAVETVAMGTLVSYVDWSNSGTITMTGGATRSVSLGAALYPVGGSNLVRLLQTLPSGLGAITGFTEDPTLGLLPTFPSGLLHALPPVFHGDLGAFVVAVTATAVILLGVWGDQRRRDRRALERF